MPIILTWNLYHGTFQPPVPTVAGASPMDRLEYIADIAQQNNVDIVCLQEVPQANLDAAVGFGVPGGASGVMTALGNVAGFNAAYTVLQALGENNPIAPQQTSSTDGYLILFRNATFPGSGGASPWDNFAYYNANLFQSLYGTYLRPPVRVELADGAGQITTVMNWHAETGPGAGWSLQILNGLLGSAAPVPRTVIGGDFNVRGNLSSVFGNFPNFVGWTNIVAAYPGPGNQTIEGLDHVLTSPASGATLGALLQFTSDAYHYPIAANF